VTFESLFGSMKNGELILIDGGICQYHLRRDGQLTIYVIISTRPGAGQEILARLKQVPGATSLFAKCPADLEANTWYAKRGFSFLRREKTSTGRDLMVWECRI
jgi:hypothetical protein